MALGSDVGCLQPLAYFCRAYERYFGVRRRQLPLFLIAALRAESVPFPEMPFLLTQPRQDESKVNTNVSQVDEADDERKAGNGSRGVPTLIKPSICTPTGGEI
jgi:hypothetical protein